MGVEKDMKLYVLVLRGYKESIIIDELITNNKAIEYYDDINSLYEKALEYVEKGRNIIIVAPLKEDKVKELLLKARPRNQIVGFLSQ